MREYRGMTIAGEWVEGNLTILKQNIRQLKAGHYISNKVGLPFAFQVRPATVGQYTGWQDDQKEKAFEGDKVLQVLTGKVYTIIWDELGSGYLFAEEGGKAGIDYYEFEDACAGFEWRIIGNIHETGGTGK